MIDLARITSMLSNLPAPIIQDTFDGANGVSLNGSYPARGNGSAWITFIYSGSGIDFVYLNGSAHAYSLTNNYVVCAYIDAKISDFSVSVDMTTKGNARAEPNGIIFRLTDTANFWRVYLTTAGALMIEKVVSGVATAKKAIFFTTSINTRYSLGVKCVLDRVSVSIKAGSGEIIKCDVYDSFNQTATNVGLIGSSFISGFGTRFDTFRVETAIPESTNPLLAHFKPSRFSVWKDISGRASAAGDMARFMVDASGANNLASPLLVGQVPSYSPGVFNTTLGYIRDAVTFDPAASDNYMIQIARVSKSVGITVCITWRQSANGTHIAYVDAFRAVSVAGNSVDRLWLRQFTNNNSINTNSNWYLCTMSNGGGAIETIDLGITYGPNWHTLIASWDMAAGILDAWLDGVRVAAVSPSGVGCPVSRPAWSADGDVLNFGASNLGAYPSSADIAELRVYNKPVTESEAASIYLYMQGS